jgi:hypothetical protein
MPYHQGAAQGWWGCHKHVLVAEKAQGRPAFPFMCIALHTTIRFDSHYWQTGPPLCLRCCSLKSMSFWLSSNTDFCVIFLDMNGGSLQQSFVHI